MYTIHLFYFYRLYYESSEKSHWQCLINSTAMKRIDAKY